MGKEDGKKKNIRSLKIELEPAQKGQSQFLSLFYKTKDRCLQTSENFKTAPEISNSFKPAFWVSENLKSVPIVSKNFPLRFQKNVTVTQFCKIFKSVLKL